MKKILAFILVTIMVLSFTACSGKKAEDTVTNTDDKTVVEHDNIAEEPEENGIKDETPAEEKEEVSIDKPEENKRPDDNKVSEENKKPDDNKKPETDKKPAEDNKPSQSAPENKPETNASNTVGEKLLAEFKAIASLNTAAIADKLASSDAIGELSLVSTPVEPGFLTGFDNAEIKGFKEGSMFAPMIGTIPFVGYVFTLEDGVSASDFIETLKASANLRWNICSEAEEMVTGSAGNKVFFVMCNKSLD